MLDDLDMKGVVGGCKAVFFEPIPQELEQKIKKLQEQLNEANEIVSIYRCYDDTECGKATEYCKKWGVK